MILNDVEDLAPQTATYVGGKNFLPLVEWAVVEGSKGKSLFVKFDAPFGDKEHTFNTYLPFQWPYDSSRGKSENDWGFFFKKKLEDYRNILAAYTGKDVAEEVFQKLCAEAFKVDFDSTSQEAVNNFEERFVVDIFKHFPKNFKEMKIPVILSWGDTYIGIPSYKENKWNPTFGINPLVAYNLRMTKREEPAFVPQTEGANDAPATFDGPTGFLGDATVEEGVLPF